MPSSRTPIATAVSLAVAKSSSRPPLGMALSPLVARFHMICLSWFSSASSHTAVSGIERAMRWCGDSSGLARSSLTVSSTARLTSMRATATGLGRA